MSEQTIAAVALLEAAHDRYTAAGAHELGCTAEDVELVRRASVLDDAFEAASACTDSSALGNGA